MVERALLAQRIERAIERVQQLGVVRGHGDAVGAVVEPRLAPLAAGDAHLLREAVDEILGRVAVDDDNLDDLVDERLHQLRRLLIGGEEIAVGDAQRGGSVPARAVGQHAHGNAGQDVGRAVDRFLVHQNHQHLTHFEIGMGEGDALGRRFGDEQGRHDGVEVLGGAGGYGVEHTLAGGDDELVVHPRAAGDALHERVIEPDDLAERVKVGEGRQRRVGGDDQQIAGGVHRQVGRRPRGDRRRDGGVGRHGFRVAAASHQGGQRRQHQQGHHPFTKRHRKTSLSGRI